MESLTNQAIPSAVKRIWVVGGADATQPTQTQLLYSRDAGRRKVSKGWRPVERFLRQFAKAQASFATDYLDRHETSSAKKKNGAVRDLVKNVGKSKKAGGKNMRWKKIFQF